MYWFCVVCVSVSSSSSPFNVETFMFFFFRCLRLPVSLFASCVLSYDFNCNLMVDTPRSSEYAFPSHYMKQA
uniref:Secreted protein n=1 Tax=Caenorhabditis tropicalis TaxID=1561998 RepID=A0A1I7TQ28_9PELO